MARMIPSLGPSEFVEGSREDEVYWALSQLPDDYIVVHSFRLLEVIDGERIKQREADFVIFNRRLGILCIEVKAGRITCEMGEWKYQSGLAMKHGGPYRQADSLKWKIMDRFAEAGLESLKHRCKMTHAVWLPSVDAHELGAVMQLPEAAREITLCRTDLKAPETQVKRIMGMRVDGCDKTDLSEAEAKEILHKVLLPDFDIVPTGVVDYDYSDFVFARLLDSQKRVLGFLQDQKVAVVNGAAGTGKTLIAVERAKQAAKTGRVLFLCYNSLLKEDISRRCADEPGIDVYTVAGFACKVCDCPQPDYGALVEKLLDNPMLFEYDHIVVDEGQDFGLREIEDSLLLETLRNIIEHRDGASMYFFYDKRQLVQGSSMPSFLAEADCKLTLYVNCRNTRSIAVSSFQALGDEESGKVKLLSEQGSQPLLFANEDVMAQEAFIDEQIRLLKDGGLDDIAVITCKTVELSALNSRFSTRKGKLRWKKTGIPVYTFRKFKGMEADAVILIDVDSSLWRTPQIDFEPEPGMPYYTAASRARHELRIVCSMDDGGCADTLVLMGQQPTKSPAKKLATVLNAKLV